MHKVRRNSLLVIQAIALLGVVGEAEAADRPGTQLTRGTYRFKDNDASATLLVRKASPGRVKARLIMNRPRELGWLAASQTGAPIFDIRVVKTIDLKKNPDGRISGFVRHESHHEIINVNESPRLDGSVIRTIRVTTPDVRGIARAAGKLPYDISRRRKYVGNHQVALMNIAALGGSKQLADKAMRLGTSPNPADTLVATRTYRINPGGQAQLLTEEIQRIDARTSRSSLVTDLSQISIGHINSVFASKAEGPLFEGLHVHSGLSEVFQRLQHFPSRQPVTPHLFARSKASAPAKVKPAKVAHSNGFTKLWKKIFR